MVTRKKSGRDFPVHQPTLFEKIGEQATHLKEELIAGKDHLLEVAGEKIAAVKESIHQYTAKKKVNANKTANSDTKRNANSAANKNAKKKPIKKVAKKSVAVKKKIVKAAKKKILVKKAAPAKKKTAPKKAVAKKTANPKKAAKSIVGLRRR